MNTSAQISGFVCTIFALHGRRLYLNAISLVRGPAQPAQHSHPSSPGCGGQGPARVRPRNPLAVWHHGSVTVQTAAAFSAIMVSSAICVGPAARRLP